MQTTLTRCIVIFPSYLFSESFFGHKRMKGLESDRGLNQGFHQSSISIFSLSCSFSTTYLFPWLRPPFVFYFLPTPVPTLFLWFHSLRFSILLLLYNGLFGNSFSARYPACSCSTAIFTLIYSYLLQNAISLIATETK
jgi:hypothetical protein